MTMSLRRGSHESHASEVTLGTGEDQSEREHDEFTLEEPPEALVDARVDFGIAVAVLALGCGLVLSAGHIRTGAIPDPIGSGGFPRMLGLLLATVGAALVGRRVLAWRRHEGNLVPSDGGDGDEADQPVSLVRPFVMLAFGLLWTLLMPRIGYLVSTWLICLLCMLGMKVTSPVKLALVPLVFSLVTWALFTRLSGLLFPEGAVDIFFGNLIPRLG